MKTIKTILVAVAACVALCFTSCTKTTDTGENFGSYSAIADVDLSSKEGSGIIYYQIRDAVINASKGLNYRTAANDQTVIAAADPVAETYKNYANKPVVVSVVFQPANAMGEAEKKPIVIKSYSFKPVE
ncbi:MAG: hypothetical protein J5801_05895 [Bacteroidales bacterium]|nr:hypothetical protein [Bacteroidales bacterium]